MTRISDVAEMAFGFAFKSSEFSDAPNDVRLLRGDNIAQGRLRWNSAKKFPLSRIDEVERYQMNVGDVVIAMDRPWIEAGLKYSVVRKEDVPSLLVQRVARLRTKSDLLDQDFLGIIIGSAAFANYVTGVQTGSTVPHISGKQIGDYEFTLPSLLVQREISATLGAFDKKIESNERAIEILQKTASEMFRTWRKEAVPVESTTFGAYAEIYGGATPKTRVPDYWGGGLAWATPTDVTGLSAPYLLGTSRTITDEGLGSCAAVMHPAGTIFMTSRATIGAFAINQMPAATNQGFIAVRPKREPDQYFLFEEMRSRVDEFVDNANGSTFLEISRGRFKELTLSVPEPGEIERIDSRIRPMHAKAAQLAKESDQLAFLRDSLLPELLAGRVRAPVGGINE